MKICENSTCAPANPCAICKRAATLFADACGRLDAMFLDAFVEGLNAIVDVLPRDAVQRAVDAYHTARREGIARLMTEIQQAGQKGKENVESEEDPREEGSRKEGSRKEGSCKETPRKEERVSGTEAVAAREEARSGDRDSHDGSAVGEAPNQREEKGADGGRSFANAGGEGGIAEPPATTPELPVARRRGRRKSPSTGDGS